MVFKESGFPRKLLMMVLFVKGKIYQSTVTYQISNNDGIKEIFKIVIVQKLLLLMKRKSSFNKKFMTEVELRSLGKR